MRSRWGLLVLLSCTGVVDSFDAGGAASGGGVATGGGSASSSGGGTTGGGGGGATAVDAGDSHDAGTPDAGVSAGCADKAWKLCEDFEGGSATALPSGWTPLTWFGQGNVGVVTGEAHGGTKSLKTSTRNPGGPRIQHSLASLGATAAKHWGRVFYKVASPAPNSGTPSAWFHITFVGLRATDESRVVDTVESPQGKIGYLYNLPDDSCCNGSSTNWTYDGAWHCTEWFVDNTTDSYRFFLDGTELSSMAFTGRADARLADFTTIALGAVHYVASTGLLETWLDDLAIDDARVGCQ
jgi:hypothetical protein